MKTRPAAIIIAYLSAFLLLALYVQECRGDGTGIEGLIAGGRNDCKPDIVYELESRWEDRAKIYWNDDGVVIISNGGYVSEFFYNGSTIHYGTLPGYMEDFRP